jgi:hypothetical protein
MELNTNVTSYLYVFVLSLIIFFLKTQSAFPSSSAALQEIGGKQNSAKTLILKINKDIALDNLISSSNYSLDDEEMVFFLKDFIHLNSTVKSISLLKKGTVIRLPLSHLKRIEGHTVKNYAYPAAQRERRKFSGKAEMEKRSEPVQSSDRKSETGKNSESVPAFERSRIIGEVKALFQSLEDNFTMDDKGLQIFDLTDKSQLSLDKSFFPLMNRINEYTLVFDYMGTLPDDLKDLIEISWPEYKIVSCKEGLDLKQIIYALLNESGYAVTSSEKLVVGGDNSIEYYPDFLVFKKIDDFMDSDISFISLLDNYEYKTPVSLLNWLNKRGLRIIEISNFDREQHKAVKSTFIDNSKPVKPFAEDVLTQLGYNFSRDETIVLSKSKGFSYELKADLSINLNNKKKLVEFTEISEQEKRYAHKEGLDIAFVGPLETKREVTRDIVKLLSPEWSDIPKKTSTYITPKRVRYRLFLPGIYTDSRKGEFFLTDSELEINLLKDWIDEHIQIVKF